VRIRLTFAVLALGLIGLVGCGTQTDADLTPEGQALTALGFDTGDVQAVDAQLEAAPAPSTSAKPDQPRAKHPKLREKLRKNVLHGETVVQTKNGTVTIAVQRGTVTAVTATSVTVKSTDGVTQTWTFGDKFVVAQHKSKVDKSLIKTGVEIGIAGPKTGGTFTARLAVLP
jgi:hypothetical protein